MIYALVFLIGAMFGSCVGFILFALIDVSKKSAPDGGKEV